MKFKFLLIVSLIYTAISFANDENEEAFCRKYWGENLIHCMQKCNKNEFKVNLLNLDGVSGQREHFFEQTLKSADDYKKLDEIHETEKDWLRIWRKLSYTEKERFFKNSKTTLIASSKANLKAFIHEKADEEYWRKVYIGAGIAGAVIVVGGGAAVIYYYGPTIVANLPSLPVNAIPVPV